MVADTPLALIELGVLSRCPDRVDVSGPAHDLDASTGTTYHARTRNQRRQTDVMHCLLSGDAVVSIRPATGLDAASLRTIRSVPVPASSGHRTLRAVQR